MQLSTRSMASFVFELFPVGRQLKDWGLGGPRLGPALVFGHQSERQSVCPSLNPRLINWGNNARLGGPEYELSRFVLLDRELHGSMGSHALSTKSVFNYVPVVPPTYSRLNLCLPSLSLPFLAFLFLTKQFLFHRATERSLNPPLLLKSLLRDLSGLFLTSAGTSPGSIALCWSAHCSSCYICMNPQSFLQPWPNRALSCPTTRPRGIREGRRHVGTDDPMHWSLLL